MSEEKIVCPECGWSGAPSARCPNCGGALYRLSPGISGAPVETLPGQAAAGMSASKEMPEAPVEDRLVSVQAAGPEDQSSEWARKSEHWAERIRTLARELPKQIEDAGEALESKGQERNNLLVRARDVRSSDLHDLDQRRRDLEEAVDAFHARASILAQVPVNAFTTSEARIAELIQDLVNTRRDYFAKRDQASRMPEERKVIGPAMGCLTFLTLGFLASLVFVAIVTASVMLISDVAGAIVTLLLGPVLLLATVGVSVNVGQYFGSTLPKRRKRAVEAERDSLDRQLDLIYARLEAETQEALQQMAVEIAGKLKEYLAEWKARASQLREEMGIWGRDWSGFTDWGPVSEPLAAVRLGELEMDIDLPLPGLPRETLSLPLLVPFTGGKGLLVLASDKGELELIREAWQSLAFRLLASVPPGKLRFTFIDPVGLGNNAAPMLHLKQYDESDDDSLVTSRAWSEPEHIRKQLAKIKEHISTVVQERLRDEYPDIAAYNRQAGEIAVPYRILFVFDFPTNFTDEAIRDLISIAETGARAGVFPIVMVDTSKQMPYGFTLDSLSARLPIADWHPLAEMNLESLKCRVLLDGPRMKAHANALSKSGGSGPKKACGSRCLSASC